MRGLILAAGCGSRLSPLTNDCPKCLVNLYGQTLLEYQLDSLRLNDVLDVSIVTGYMAEKIIKKGWDFEFVFHNKNYLNNNMVSSLLMAKDIFNSELVVSYSDIVYSPEVVQQLVESEGDFNIVVDDHWYALWKNRFSKPLSDAESLKVNGQGLITEIGKKAASIEEIEAQYIGLMKFSKKGLSKILDLYKEGELDIKNGKKAWGTVDNLSKAYFTDLIMALIKKGEKISPVRIKGDWFELDTYKDFLLYEEELSNLKNKKDLYNIGRS